MPLEWLIDLIKEWVIAQAYATIVYVDAQIAATRAWVEAKLYLPKAEYPGYGMPIHVIGDTTPDVTCTYFRAGDHEGKPYYSQEDGSYFIWWNGTKWIIGTQVPGPPGTRKFDRVDPSVFGDYTSTPGTSGTPTVISGYKYLLTSFVDRGDPAAVDFAQVNFTKDAAWHELDLSGIVPAGAKAVVLAVSIQRVTVVSLFEVRRHGNANNIVVSVLGIDISSLINYADFTTAVDADRKIDYRVTAGFWPRINVTVKGWWL